MTRKNYKNKIRKVRNVSSKVLSTAAVLAALDSRTSGLSAPLEAISRLAKPKGKKNKKTKNMGMGSSNVRFQTSKVLIPTQAQPQPMGNTLRSITLRDVNRTTLTTGAEGNEVLYVNPNSIEYFRDKPALTGSNEYPVDNFDSAWQNVQNYSSLDNYDHWCGISGYVRILPLMNENDVAGAVTVMQFQAGSDPANGFDPDAWPTDPSSRTPVATVLTMKEINESGGILIPFIAIDQTPNIARRNEHAILEKFYCIAIFVEGSAANQSVLQCEIVYNYAVLPGPVSSSLLNSLGTSIVPTAKTRAIADDLTACSAALLRGEGLFRTSDPLRAQRMCATMSH